MSPAKREHNEIVNRGVGEKLNFKPENYLELQKY